LNRTTTYWVATIFIAGNAVVAGTMDILWIQPFFGILRHLGYPAYFGTLLGVWKVLGAVVLIAPGYPLVKEWAYAGSFFDYTSAVVSYVAVGEASVSNIAGPFVSLVFLVASWVLRPSSRRWQSSLRIERRHILGGD
jgi:hypothetical protein